MPTIVLKIYYSTNISHMLDYALKLVLILNVNLYQHNCQCTNHQSLTANYQLLT